MPPSPAKSKDNKPKNRLRRAAERGGRRGEFWAALYLRLKLYSIVATRFKSPVGEIDLVARRFGVTVFVEVKSRAFSSSEAGALEAVNKARITRAAQFYVTRHPHLAATPLRFDVIFLAPFAWPRHVKNAFGLN